MVSVTFKKTFFPLTTIATIRLFIAPLLVLFLSNVWTTQQVCAQSVLKHSETLEWASNAKEIVIKPDESIRTLYFKNAGYDYYQHFLPVYTKEFPLNYAGDIKVQLKNTEFQTINIADLSLDEINETLKPDIVIRKQLAYDRKRPIAVVDFIPLRKNETTGQIEQLVRFDLEVKIQANTALYEKSGNRSYVQNSVLSQGTFYKFRVQENGIYQIDQSFIDELGISENMPVNNIRIYGYGGLLPELAGGEKYDDLPELPIRVNDNNGNAVFDEGDNIVFYAQGPNQWVWNKEAKRYIHQPNYYSNYSHYFLNYDIGTGKRIVTETPPPGNANLTFSTFDENRIYEKDDTNFIMSGRRWYGEEFHVLLEQDFNFNIPDLELESPISITSRVASRAAQGDNFFRVRVNGQLIHSHTVSKTGFDYDDPFAKADKITSTFTANKEELNVQLKYDKTEPNSRGWLDYIELNAKRKLIFSGGQMMFRNQASVGENMVAGYNIAGNNVEVWEVSKTGDIKKMQNNVSDDNFSFRTTGELLKEFIVFDGSQYLKPEAIGKIESQNLHSLGAVDMIIVSHANFLNEAEQVADFHRERENLDVAVVDVAKIYNEFSSGTPDVTAIRDFVKMFYDRAGDDNSLMPDYLLLFGDASYDFKNIIYKEELNTNFVPAYQSMESIVRVSSYATDDYFAFLDDTDGKNLSDKTAKMDIGVGRFPVKNNTEAQTMIEKLKRYTAPEALGPWRNQLTFIADDEDSNIHLDDAERHTEYIWQDHNVYNVEKLYLDAYEQISTPGGNRYPAVNEAIHNKIFTGSFVMNYVGHGGENGWSHERILNISDFEKWDNLDRLPVFITATCSFSRYDDPKRTSAGEQLLLYDRGGAIALMTTIRVVFASSNEILNREFLEHLFQPVNGKMPAIGEIARRAKNESNTNGINTRKFVLLGDPALTLAFPKYSVKTTNISVDTLKALGKVTIKGEVLNENNDLYSSFNGFVYPVIYDKKQTIETLVNDKGSKKEDFQVRNSIIFKGKASVTNGEFEFSFIVPKDINYEYGFGRISYYADDDLDIDANGYDESIIVGGLAEDIADDGEGPKIELYMNDEKFIFGGTTNNSPMLLAKLKDDSGINTARSGIGHDITGKMDENTKDILILNDYYNTLENSYQEGEIRYPLSELENGRHSIEVKAWDVHNNAGTGYTEFVVAESAEIALQNVLNYPNPFTEQTAFWFEHNMPGQELTVTIQIMSMSGRIVKTIQENIIPEGFRVDDIKWDGLDDYGNKIGRGVYIYKLSVRSPDNKTANHIERLVILK